MPDPRWISDVTDTINVPERIEPATDQHKELTPLPLQRLWDKITIHGDFVQKALDHITLSLERMLGDHMSETKAAPFFSSSTITSRDS